MAAKAVENLNGKVLQGSLLKSRLAVHDKDKGFSSKPSANLYVCNLPPHYTVGKLREIFQVYGKIISLVVLTNPTIGVHARPTARLEWCGALVTACKAPMLRYFV